MSSPFPEAICVVGAGRGIGRAVALACAKSGADVLCISQSAKCEETRREITVAGGRASALQLDVADHAPASRAIAEWAERSKGKRIGLIVAAAILGPQGPLSPDKLAEWEAAFRVNLFGTMAVVGAALPAMIVSGFGRVITFAGGGSSYAYPTFPAYSASKTALVRAVENIGEDLAPHKDIGIVCVAPGAIETDLLASVKAAGGTVRTPGDMSLVLNFVSAFMTGDAKAINGRLVHVKDDYQKLLTREAAALSKDHWTLRRVE